jgi:hypothetical protein
MPADDDLGPIREAIRRAREAIRDARRQAHIAKGTYWGRMNPEPLTHDKTAALVSAVEDVAHHATWLARTLERALGDPPTPGEERIAARLAEIRAKKGQGVADG